MVHLRKLSDTIFEIEKAVIILFLGLIFIVLVMDVVFRYFLNNALIWGAEFSIFCLAWVTFIGGSMTVKKKQAATITFFTDKLAENIRGIVIIVATLVVFCFTVFILISSIQWITSPHILHQRSMALQIPMVIPYAGIPIGFGFMSIHSLVLLIDSIKYVKQGGALE